MALTIKIGDTESAEEQGGPEGPPVSIQLDIRKAVDGSVLIFDHPEVDIAILPKNRKIVVFPKEKISDRVYDVQDRFFKFLGKSGAILLNSVQGGSIYSSLEAEYAEAGEADPLQTVIYAISKFIQDERDYFNISKEIEEEFEKSLTDPEDAESTELGEVPHAHQKGSIRPGYIYHPYGISSLYRYE